MRQFVQTVVSLAILFQLGTCVADLPTAEEVFEEMNMSVERSCGR